jgi:malonyl-CoA O-methyltransferase
MAGIDRARVKKAFHRQAGLYDETVVVQKRVIEEIVRQLQRETDAVPRRVLDIGAGTGLLLRAVRDLFPESLLVGLDMAQGMGKSLLWASPSMIYYVVGDAELIPFTENSFDLVVSTSAFQWLDALDTAFQEAERVLDHGGIFRFALFGGKTLWELRTSYAEALREAGRPHDNRTHRFFSREDVEAALDAAGFMECRTFCGIEVDYHEDIPHLLRSLKRIGAGNATQCAGQGLSLRTTMEKMISIYRRDFLGSSGVPSTYEVIYGYGRKK